MAVAATIDIGLTGNRIEREIAAQLSAIEKRGIRLNIQNNNGLGQISGQANQFTKSLEAAESRVLAFTATAGSLYLVTNAMKALFNATVEVEKSLADINVVLNRSANGIQKFGAELFNIARQTGQSFSEVSKAALEFSRQGLGVEETLKRTRDALILTRLSGLDVVSSTEAITAALNSFNNTVIDSTQLINKLAAVDASFAVSSADLAEGLKRVGAVAQDVGLSLDQTIGFITSLQQTTARGGANIGNSLKSIFQRVERPETLDLFDKLKIATVNANNELLGADQILKNVAAKFGELDPVMKGTVSQFAAGTYQANAFRSIMRDLAKDTSAYDEATKKSSRSVNEAIDRNKDLNVTLSALISRTGSTVKQFASQVGDQAISSSARAVLSTVEKSLGATVENQTGPSIGSELARGMFKGIGTFIAGPGAFVFSAALISVGKRLIGFAIEATKTLLVFGQRINANDSALNSTVGKFELIRQKVLATNSLLARQSNILVQIGQGGGAISPLTQGASPSRGLSKFGAPTILGVPNTLGVLPSSASNYTPDYLAGPGPIPLFNIPKSQAGIKASEIKASYDATFGAGLIKNSFKNETIYVNQLLRKLQDDVTKDPRAYSSPARAGSVLAGIAAQLQPKSPKAFTSGNKSLTYNGLDDATIEGVILPKARSILNQAPLTVANSQIKRAALVDNISRYGTGLAIAAPIIGGQIQNFFDRQDTPQSRATSQLVGGVANAVSVGAIISSVAKQGAKGLGPIAATALTANSAYDFIKNRGDDTPELKKRLETATERLSSLADFINRLKDLDDKIGAASKPNDIQTLSRKRAELIGASRFGTGNIAELEGKAGTLQSERIIAEAALRLRDQSLTPRELSQDLLSVKSPSSGQDLFKFISSLDSKDKATLFAGGSIVGGPQGELQKDVLKVFEKFGNADLSKLFKDALVRDSGIKSAFGLGKDTNTPILGGLVESFKTFREEDQQSQQIGKTLEEYKKSIRDLINATGKEVISTLSLNERTSELIDSRSRIRDLEIQSGVRTRVLNNANPISTLNFQRGGERSSIISGFLSESQKSFGAFRSSVASFGLPQLEELRNKPGNEQARDALISARSQLLPLVGDTNAFSKKLEELRGMVPILAQLNGVEEEFNRLEKSQSEFIEKGNDLLNKRTIALSELSAKYLLLNKETRATESRDGVEERFAGGFLSGGQRIDELNRIAQREIFSGNFSKSQQFSNAGSDFTKVFDYSSGDFFSDIRKGAIDTAQTIKSEFSGAFKEFARGTKDAGEAFRDFALNIAFSVQDKLIDVGINSLLGSVFGGSTGALSGLFKNKGGKIGRYSDGGLVTGGSGVSDDVAAKLAPGDFVMQRSAVSKYGIDSFSTLNNGVDISLGNSFGYNSATSPTGGSASISPFLSGFGLEDDNNPQNVLRNNRLENLRSYLGERSSYELQKSDAISKFNSQKRQQLIGTYISAALAGFGGVYGSRGTGPKGSVINHRPIPNSSFTGPVPGLAAGGAIFGNDSSSDTVPAYLTAGEYVIKRSAASRIGYNNLEAMNQGKFPRFAYGGSVGGNPLSDSANDSLLKLISLNEQLNKSFIEFSVAKNGSNTSVSPLNNQAPVSVVVNVNTTVDSKGGAKSDANASVANENDRVNPENSKQLADGIRSVVLDEILKQSRPGGLLAR